MTRAKDDKARARIDRFFEREVMPLARALKTRGAAMLATGQDPAADSYYVHRRLPAMDAQAFEWGGAESETQLRVSLVELWRDPASRDLASLAPSLARLARELHEAEEEQPAELPAFVYVMY